MRHRSLPAEMVKTPSKNSVSKGNMTENNLVLWGAEMDDLSSIPNQPQGLQLRVQNLVTSRDTANTWAKLYQGWLKENRGVTIISADWGKWSSQGGEMIHFLHPPPRAIGGDFSFLDRSFTHCWRCHCPREGITKLSSSVTPKRLKIKNSVCLLQIKNAS